jgi:lipoic acid synthetase
MMTEKLLRKPPWLKVRIPQGPNYRLIKGLTIKHRLHTVCESACCPNIGECWERRTATFMILGDLCTRNCRFCAVSSGRPFGLDEDEPQRVAQAAARLGLKYAVITSVTRDDLADGGASIFAATAQAIRAAAPDCRIELLVPDFAGSKAALQKVFDAKPDVFGHNLETVPRLYDLVRPQAQYQRSLKVLELARENGLVTKSGIMVGLGETEQEVQEVIRDLAEIGCDILTLGQYLRPSKGHLPVARYYSPEEFAVLKSEAENLGFKAVESGPLVRSSYHADLQAQNCGWE